MTTNKKPQELLEYEEAMKNLPSGLIRYADDPHSGGGEKEKKEALKIIKEIESGKYG